MKKVLILLLLMLGAAFAFAQGVTFSTPEGSYSLSFDGLEDGETPTTGYIIDEILGRLETLQESYLVKLKKADSRKANKLVDEIYYLLSLLPEDTDIFFEETDMEMETETTTNNNTNANSNSSEININIINSQAQQTPPPPPVYQTPPPPPPHTPGMRMVMPDSEFGDLLSRIGRESFSDDQLRVLRTAAKNYRFTCSQIVRLIGTYTYSDDKLEALRIAYPDCPDPQNNYKILDAFTYSTDKEEASSIID